MGPSSCYLAVALALFVALDPGLGGAPLPSKPTCRHGTRGQDLQVLREALRGGRPSRDSARGSEEIRHSGARTQSPSARERMKAFGATTTKRNVTEERAEMVHRLIEEQHQRRSDFLHANRMRKLSESLGVSAAPHEEEAAAAPDAPRKDQGEQAQKEVEEEEEEDEEEDNCDDIKVTMVGGEVVWDLGNYSSKIADICTPAKVAPKGDEGDVEKVAADDDDEEKAKKDGGEEDVGESKPNLGLRGGGGNDDDDDDDDDDGDVAFSSHSDMSGGGEPGAGVGVIDGDDDGEGQGGRSAKREGWARTRREEDLEADGIEEEMGRRVGRQNDLLRERLWQRDPRKEKEEDYEVSSVGSEEDPEEAGGRGNRERREQRRKRKLEEREKVIEKLPKRKREAILSSRRKAAAAKEDEDVHQGAGANAEGKHDDPERLATTLASLLEGVKKGDLNMTVSAGLCYYHGRGTTVDTAYAIELLTKAAEGGSERGAYNLGAIYGKGGVGLEKNSSRAVGWYRLSAKWGYAAAQYRLAETLRGQGKEEEALEWYLEASKKGHVSSMLKGGMLLLSKSKKAAGGGGGDGSGWEGAGGRLIRQAAGSGSGKAMYLLASKEDGGIGPWLRKSAESGHVPAMAEWGLALLNGNGSVPVQVHVAAVWLLKAAKGGDAGAQAKIGAMYIEGFPRRIGEQYHEVKDQKEGYRWVHEAAKQGASDAQYAIGLYYMAGQELPHILREEKSQKGTHDRYAGFEPTIGNHKAKPRTHKQEMRDQAMLWFRRAANQGNVEAMWELSQLIISANIHKKVAKLVAARQEAFGLILGAAEAGMAVAQAEMGHIWRDGRWGIVSPNATASAGWFSLAARNGFPSAQLELAYALIGGLGVAKDEVKACGWLERASQAGIAEARYELGARHIGIAPRTVRSADKNIAIGAEDSRGEGGEVGSSPGIRWDAGLGEKLLASAASGGHTGAMLMLGRWCLGVGTKRRREEGLGWLRKAAESGLGEAQKEYGEGLLEDANGRDKAVVEEGVLFLKEAVKNGVAGAAESMKKWTKTLGMQPKAPGGSETTFGAAHLMSDHVLHTEVGRLKIKVVRAEKVPRVCTGTDWGVGVDDGGKTHIPACSVVLSTGAGGEGEEEEGEEAVRWTKMVKRPGGLLQRGVENSREVGEQRHAQDVQTHVSKNRGGSPEWNATFAAYLNGSKSAWHEPMEVSLVAHVSSRVGTVVVARGSFMPWEVPLKRAIRKWVDVKVERTPQVMNSKGGRVLLEMWRTRDKLPLHIAQSQASKDLAALPPWVMMQNSHSEARERRRQAEIDKLADEIFDPTMIQMGDGHVVPFEVLNMYENPNIFEPIVGLHKDPRFLSEHFGDFNRFVVRDIWTEKTEKGRWMVPNGEKIDKSNRKDDWYKWLRKFSGGKLTYDDCPPGSISPFLTSQQVTMELKRRIWAKESKAKLADLEARQLAEKKKLRKASKVTSGATAAKQQQPLNRVWGGDVKDGKRSGARGFLTGLRDASLADLSAPPPALTVN